MKHNLITAALALGGALTSFAAQAGNVYWSVGVSAPLDGYGGVQTVVGNVPPAPVVVQPAPVVVPVGYYPSAPRYVVPAWGYRHERWERHEAWEHRGWYHGDGDRGRGQPRGRLHRIGQGLEVLRGGRRRDLHRSARRTEDEAARQRALAAVLAGRRGLIDSPDA